MDIPALVSFEQLKSHLRLSGTDEDADLRAKLEQATDAVLNDLKQRISGADDWAEEVDAWTDETVPPRVVDAILVQTAALFRFRGDDEQEPKWIRGLAPRTSMILDRWFRDPAIA